MSFQNELCTWCHVPRDSRCPRVLVAWPSAPPPLPSIPFPQGSSAPQASVTALRPRANCSGASATFSPHVRRRFFKCLCMNSLLSIASLPPATVPPAGLWVSPQDLPHHGPDASKGNSDTQGNREVPPGSGGEGTRLGPCALFNSTFWHKENLRSDFRAFDT